MTTSTPDVRTLDPDDLVAWCSAMTRTYFGGHDPKALAEMRRSAMDYTRALAGYDGDRVVATFRSFTIEVTVPGGAAVPVDAVTNVAVLPTHHRRGYLSEMMRRDLAAAVDRGEPAAILISSEWPIYGRYGFGAASEHARYEVDARAARFRTGGDGEVDYADDAEARAAAPAVFATHLRSSPSELNRIDRMWDLIFGIIRPPWASPANTVNVLCRSEGVVTGYARYAVSDDGEDRAVDGVVTLEELIASTPAAYARLWEYVCRIDLVATVRAANRSVADPLRWLLTDARAVRQRMRADYQWVRLLDVPRMLTARSYPTSGRLVLEVADPLGHAAGRYALEVDQVGATCHRTTEDPDVAMDVSTLGSLYYGGTGAAELAVAGRLVECRPGAVDRCGAMFSWPVTPWSATWF